MTLRTISYGGGVQSTALLVLATQGLLDDVIGGTPSHALFANVGDDSEDPRSTSYVRDVARPWAEPLGVTVLELRRTYADGRPYPTLRELSVDPKRRGIPIPVYGSNAGAPGGRACTQDWKIGPIHKWLKAHGASDDNPATVCIGISTDEIERAGRGRNPSWERRVYPLLDLGLNRADCLRIITDAGLPAPIKSSCYFCPFHSRATWKELRRDRPDLFASASEMETELNKKRVADGKTPVYLTKTGRPLADAIIEAQTPLFDADGPSSCDSGYCWT